MTEPVVIEPMMQKDVWDCSVACLAMILGKSYQEVRTCIRYKKPVGLSLHEVRRIAKRLGEPLRFSKAVDHEDIGILWLDRSSDPKDDEAEHEGHTVVYVKGTVYNPAQGQWWTDVDSYLKASRYVIEGILQRRD